MRGLRTSEWAILAFIIVYSFLPTFGALFRVLELAGGPAVMPANPRASAIPLPIVLHILSSFVFLLLGAFQFLPSIRQKHPAAHRLFGRFVALAGCLSAGSGVWMTHVYSFPISLQGSLLYSVRITLGLLMIGFIIWAVFAIRSRNVFRHRSLMLRAYAIGQGASTQAFIGIGWMILSGTEATGPLRDVQMVSGWAINMLIAEALIWKTLHQSGPLRPFMLAIDFAGARRRTCHSLHLRNPGVCEGQQSGTFLPFARRLPMSVDSPDSHALPFYRV